MFMLDTNICIFVMNNRAGVIERFYLEQPLGSLYISAVTEAELWFGVENSSHYERNSKRLYNFLALVGTLDFNSSAAVEYGRIRCELKRNATPIGERDMFIAAHAKSLGYILATDNTREFNRINGLKISNWVKN
jgi:tRNA(fMet)-specific endonuclease VapC